MSPRAVSVVIPCYNQSIYLKDALASVVAQTVAPVDIIVVDDGSTEDLRTVTEGFPGVSYLRQDNCGLAAARNRGLREARGEFVTFLDADDLYLPYALEAGLRTLAADESTAFAAGRFRYLNEDGVPRCAEPRDVPTDPYAAMLRSNFIVMHATVMYRSDAIRKAGAFDEGLRACEDYDLYLRMARQWKLRLHDAVIAEYRKHGNNMSERGDLMLRASVAVLRRQEEYVREHPQYADAYAEGLRFWRHCYASKQLRDVRASVRSRQWSAAGRLGWRYVTSDPSGAAMQVSRAIARRLDSIGRRWQGRRVHFGSLRRLEPLSRSFGYDRGLPIDRHYIEGFLARHSEEITGRVLEVGDNTYTRRFGGGRVVKSDVLHVDGSNAEATLVADLSNAPELPSDAFDCVIITQTLHFIFDLEAAVATLYRICRAGGVVLATFPGISQLSTDRWSDVWYWSLTQHSAARLFSRFEDVRVETHGNVLAAAAFLYGLAARELTERELEHADSHYPLLVTVRARKAG